MMHKVRQTWLDVSMNDVLRVNVIQGRANAGHIERHVNFFEHVALAEVVAKVSAGLKIQDKEAALFILECKVQVNDE